MMGPWRSRRRREEVLTDSDIEYTAEIALLKAMEGCRELQPLLQPLDNKQGTQIAAVIVHVGFAVA